MFLLQTTINIGEASEKASEYLYNENWVGFVLTALSAMAAAYFAIRVVKIDHRKQREAREEEKRLAVIKEENNIKKQNKDLRNYIYEMSDALTYHVEEQVNVHKDLIDFMNKNKYTGIEKKQVFSITLDRLSYVTPKQAYEIFITGLPTNSHENSKRLREYYTQLERIQGAQKIDKEVTVKMGTMLEQSFAKFVEVVQVLHTFKGRVVNEIVSKNLHDLNDFGKKLSILYSEFGLKSKKLKYDHNSQVVPNDDMQLPDSEKINLAMVSKEYLFDKLYEFLYRTENLKNPYRSDFLELTNQGNIALSEFDVVINQYKKSIQNSIEVLTEAGGKVRNIMTELKTLYND